jgi:Ca2+/Na+ antiporter
MQRITWIGVLSLGRVAGAVGALLGLVAGASYALAIAGFGAVGLQHQRIEATPVLLLALIVFLAVPIVTGLVHFVLGVLYALLLNLVLRLSGGLHVRIER